MRKIKEVLRLHSLGLSQRQIATSCAVAQATVSDYLKTAEAAGLRWPGRKTGTKTGENWKTGGETAQPELRDSLVGELTFAVSRTSSF